MSEAGTITIAIISVLGGLIGSIGTLRLKYYLENKDKRKENKLTVIAKLIGCLSQYDYQIFMLVEGYAKTSYYDFLCYKHKDKPGTEHAYFYKTFLEHKDYYAKQNSKYRESKILLEAEIEVLTATFSYFYPGSNFYDYFNKIVKANHRTTLLFKTMKEVENTTMDEINELLDKLMKDGVGGEISLATDFLIEKINK